MSDVIMDRLVWRLRILEDALEVIAGGHMERDGYCQSDVSEFPDLGADEAMKTARAALSKSYQTPSFIDPFL